MHAWSSHAPRRGIAAGAGFALLLLAVGTAAGRPVSAVSPATIAVSTVADGHLDSGATTCTSAAAGGRCTLRAALELNDAGAGGSTITLGGGQYQLTQGQLVANKSVTVGGAGATASVVLASPGARVIQVGPGAAPVTMTALAIENGRATGGDSEGGGIANDGSLTLRDVTVQGNSGTIGGGILDVGSLTLQSGVLITKNHAFGIDGSAIQGEGGGIGEFGTLTASGAVLTGNEAGGFVNGADNGFGGDLAVGLGTDASGAVVLRGRATVTDTTIAQGVAAFGAGVFVDAGESAAVTASTFAGNTADGGADGGGLLNGCGAVTLANDTFDGNSAPEGFGGAVNDTCEPDTAATTVRTPAPPHPAAPAVAPLATTPLAPARPSTSLDFVTIAGGTALSGANFAAGAGLVSAGTASSVTVHDSVIANGASNAAHNCATFEGKIVSLGYNLEDRGDCGFTGAGDLESTDPKIGALKDNGGPTQTMALVAGTPAVDAADPKCDVTTDQRGVTRPQGARCDIGAFELAVAATPGPSPTASPTAEPSPPMTGVGPGTGSSGLPPGTLLVALALLLAAGAAALVLLRRRGVTPGSEA